MHGINTGACGQGAKTTMTSAPAFSLEAGAGIITEEDKDGGLSAF